MLQNFLEGEAFVIIRNTDKGNGLEGWRKLSRRYDPATGAKKSSLLRHILTPRKCKLEELNEKVERWMERLNRCEARRGTGGQRESLPDVFEMLILESMCPPEIERHLQLNGPRLMGFDDMHSELATYLETRVGLKLKIGNLGSTGKKDDDAMDDCREAQCLWGRRTYVQMENDGTRCVRNVLCEEAYEVGGKLESLSRAAEPLNGVCSNRMPG